MSENVVPFALPEPKDPVFEGPAICLNCRHEWQAEAPVGVWQLECPACTTMKGLFRYPVGANANDLFFACNCGCEALTAYKRGDYFYLRCMNCGVDHTDAIFEGFHELHTLRP